MRRLELDRDMISCVGMLAIAALGLHLLVSRLVQSHPVRSPAKTASVRETAAQTQLEAAVRNAGMMSAREASSYSSHCFAKARLSRKHVSADPCVGFDMAYVYWRETKDEPLVSDPYFQPNAMSSRAQAAFSDLNPIGAAARVQSIRAATLKAIMRTPTAADEFALAFSGSSVGSKGVQPGSGPAEALPKED